MLLKRFKNRLKTLDGAFESMNASKIDRIEFEKFRTSLDKERAQSVFNDMKSLFDSTVIQFDEKMVTERN